MEFPFVAPRITYKDIIEIFIIAFFIYQLLLLIRGTRAIQILQGVGVLLVSLGICNFFALRTLSWLLYTVIVMIFVAIPIVFQPELRRALGQIGKGGILSLFSNSEEEFSHIIDEIIDACFYMSRKKIGAIIVIEREIGLEEFMETGTQLHSDITSRLLQTVFYPNSPLHDGAVIIKDNKIDSAGCYLPLTESLEVNKDLGTRHRAAIGITEHTDCISIVVSEETGSVSACSDGELNYDMTIQALAQHLRTLCRPKRIVEKTLFSFPIDITKNIEAVVYKKKPALQNKGDVENNVLKRDVDKVYPTKKLIPVEKPAPAYGNLENYNSMEKISLSPSLQEQELASQDSDKNSKDFSVQKNIDGREKIVNIKY